MEPINNICLSSSLDLSSLRSYVRSCILPYANQSDEKKKKFPLDIYRELHRLGWLQSFLPREMNGMELQNSDLIHVSRALAYGSGGIFTTFTANMLGMTPVLRHGQKKIAQRLAKEAIDRLSLWSFCMTEPDTGSNITHLATRAKRVKGGYSISGSKCFITNANVAEHYCVFARIEDSSQPKPVITAFYMPSKSNGITHGKVLEKLGQIESDTGEVFFENVFVPEAHRIGLEGQGIEIATESIQRSKTLISAASRGVCDRAHDLIVEFLANRVLYGKPLLAQSSIQNLIAQLETEAEAGWLLTAKAAGTWDQGSPAVKEASMAKLFSTHTAVRYVSEVLELFGGAGYTRDLEIERLYRDVRLFEIYEGPTFVQQALITREILPILKALKMPGSKKAA